MIDLIPYFAGLITMIFGLGFMIAIREGNRNQDKSSSLSAQ